MKKLINTIIKLCKTVLLLLAVQFFLFGSCNKNSTKPCLNGGYAFNATSEWSPQKETYNIGDTIYLNSVLLKTLQDQINPSMIIEYSNSVKIAGLIGIGYLDTITKNAFPARSKFDFFALTGSITENTLASDRSINTVYQELTSTYEIKVGVVCKQKGIYLINVDNLISNGLRGKDCTNAKFTMTVINTQKHFNLYDYALGHSNDADGIRGGYCFRVQ